jgi:hypothetical protein
MTLRSKRDIEVLKLTLQGDDTLKQVSIYKNKKIYCYFSITVRETIAKLKTIDFDIVNLY